MKREIITAVCAALTLALVSCGSAETPESTPEKSAASSGTTTTAIVETESVVKETTAETEPAETETTTEATTTEAPETTTEPVEETIEELPDPPQLKCLANSKQISIDDIPTEDKEVFEEFISENNLKGWFFDHIEISDDTPILYFIPNEEIISNIAPYMYNDNEKSITVLCPSNYYSNYFSTEYINNYIDYMGKYTIFTNFTEKDYCADNLPLTWHYINNNYEINSLSNTIVFIPWKE